MTTPPTDVLPEGVSLRTVDSEGVIRFWDGQGMLHNPVGPAVIWPDKSTFWLVTGRDPDGVGEGWFNQRRWIRHGMLHRTDGPAIELSDGSHLFRVDGRELTENEFYQRFPASLESSTLGDPA